MAPVTDCVDCTDETVTMWEAATPAPSPAPTLDDYLTTAAQFAASWEKSPTASPTPEPTTTPQPTTPQPTPKPTSPDCVGGDCDAAFAAVWEEPAAVWVVKKRYQGLSCDEICAAERGSCVQDELDALNGGSANLFRETYLMAGHYCLTLKFDCEENELCVDYGSPYIHTGGGTPTGHFEKGNCWGGSAPTVAPCTQRPADGQHTRLCPCLIRSEPSLP